MNIPSKPSDAENVVYGTVTESLPNALFRVRLDKKNEADEEKIILTYLAGKMRLNRIRVLIGDKVKIELDPYGGKGRIRQRM